MKTKIVAAIIIWAGVSFLAVRAWQSYREHTGGGPNSPQSRQERRREAREAAEERNREIEEFFAESMPNKISIKTSRSSTPENRDRRERRRDGALYFIAYGQRVSEVYAQLRHISRRRVSELPDDDQRWDVRIRAPKNSLGDLPRAFLDHMGYDVKQTSAPVSGFRLVDSPGAIAAAVTPAPQPAPAAPRGRRNAGRTQVPASPLGQMAGFLEARTGVPVVADAPLRGRRPSGNPATIPVDMGTDEADLIGAVAAQYGAKANAEDLPVTHTLVYHRKKTTSLQIGIWENSAGIARQNTRRR